MRFRNALAVGVAVAVAGCSLLTSTSGLSDAPGTPDAEGGDGSVMTTDGGAVVPADAAKDSRGDGDGAAAKTYRQEVLLDAPRAYWRLGETTGGSANDEMGTFNGFYKNGVTLGTPGAIVGDDNGAASFDGTDDYVELGDILDFPAGAGFSIEAWIKPATIDATYRNVLSKIADNANSQFNGYSIYIQQTLGLHFVLCRDDATSCPSPIAPAPTANAWHHVVGTFGSGQARLYVDGALRTSKSIAYTLLDTAVSFRIGSEQGYGYFKGNIDEVAIYGQPLSAERVLAHYAAATAP